MSQHPRFDRSTSDRSAEGAQSAGTAVFVLPALSADTDAVRAGVQQVDPLLLSETYAVTGLDAAEICRRHPENLANPEVAQPIVYLLGYAYGRLLERHGVRARALAGHSLGQYAALALADAIDFEAGLRLVNERAQAIASVSPPTGSQLVKVQGLNIERVEQICVELQADVSVTAIAASDEVTLRGDETALASLASRLRGAGATRVILLMSGGALHTSLMRVAAQVMGSALADTQIRDPRCAIASSVSGRLESDPQRWRELLAQEPVSTVRWHECFASLPGGIPVLEVGATGGLAVLAADAEPDRTVMTIDSLEAVKRAAEVCSPTLV